MKTILVISLLLAATLTGGSIYDFKVEGLDGNNIDFSKYKGQKIMIVNTASKCGKHHNMKVWKVCINNTKANWSSLVFLPIILVGKNRVPVPKFRNSANRIMV